ncbi:dicarboxylate/amino acid:cation symporter [candidate division CSSED10-310 bacterium]|uniref:Dicarboxylate/amino acid:cation symporter n=1 Tax=candidate division CSSED10-310 bacterium TaxID=2855610 RepID=A0ABV6Z6Z6_UNCC1
MSEIDEEHTANQTNQIAPEGSQRSIFIGIIIAIVLGITIGGWLPHLAVKFAILGEIFLNSLMMIVVPLVIFSMIVGITGLGDIRNLGSIGWRTVMYYMITTGISVSIGLVLVNIINPGKGISPGEKHVDFQYSLEGPENRQVVLSGAHWKKTSYNERFLLMLLDQNVQGVIKSIAGNSVTVEGWHDLGAAGTYLIKTEDGSFLPIRRQGEQLISAVPVLSPTGQGVQITLAAVQRLKDKEARSVGDTLEEVLVGDKKTKKEGMIPRNVFNAMVNMEILPLIIFSLLFGAALSVMGSRGQSAVEVISVFNDAVMRIVHWIMLLAPFGIFGLIAARIGHAGGFRGFMPELIALGKYSLTVLLGLSIHAFVVLALILFFVARRNPISYASGVGSALLNAFSTASSSATLPLTMDGVKRGNGVSNRIASFVLPLGATINMDGTALYEAVAAMFIAQVYGITLGPIQQLIIFLTATLAAIGAAGIPEAGLVTMVIVLKAVGLPIEGIGLILSIDWLLDRFRTTVNVWGDSVGAGVIEALEAKSAPNHD